MIKKIFPLILALSSILLGSSYEEGKSIFQKKCASCHGDYISIKKLKENFFEKKNKLLNLEAPPVNMIVYDLTRGSKKLGDESDLEMRQIEIEEFLLSYLQNPNRINSLTDEFILSMLKEKKPMKIDAKEASALAIYFMEYRKNRVVNATKIKEKKNLKVKHNSKEIIDKSILENKNILVYATSKTCYYCIKMQKEVLSLKEIIELTNKNYIFVKVDVDFEKLPLDLDKKFSKMTPTFFFLDSNKKILNIYPGAWKKEDYIRMLKENIKL